MFYFTFYESKISESFTFWNNLQEKNELFHDILIYWDAPVYANEDILHSMSPLKYYNLNSSDEGFQKSDSYQLFSTTVRLTCLKTLEI